MYYVSTILLTRSPLKELVLTFRDICLGVVRLIECRLAVRDIQESVATFPCAPCCNRTSVRYTCQRCGLELLLLRVRDIHSGLCLSSATPQITICGTMSDLQRKFQI